MTDSPENEDNVSKKLLQKVIKDPTDPRLDSIPKDEGRGLPTVYIQRGKLSSYTTETEKHLVNLGVDIYRSGGRLVVPEPQEVPASDNRKTHSASLKELNATHFRDIMSGNMNFRRWSHRDNRYVFVDPPRELAETLLERPGIFRPITGLMSTPSIRPDGSLIYREGYDPLTGLFLVKPPEINVPPEPARADALDALATLEMLLEEFPFTTMASKSVALSALMTPVARAALSATPMHTISATTAGTGKSYLVDIASTIASGQPCPVMSAGRDETEMEKRLGAAIVAGRPMTSIDNVNGVLAGDFLCQVIDRPQADVRILGHTKLVRVHNSIVLFSTGNNIQPSGDVIRRTIVADLDARMERPETRRFRNNPLILAAQSRGRYITAILTIIRAYIQADKPSVCEPLGSFAEWSNYIRAPLIWLGCEDPTNTMIKSREQDPALVRISTIFEALEEAGFNAIEGHGTAGDILAAAELRSNHGLREALGLISRRHELLPDNQALGFWLNKHKDRVVGGLRLCVAAKSEKSKKSNQWFVERLQTP